MANAYLYTFDIYIDNLKKDLDFIFLRYADDMVILSKDINVVHNIVEKINLYFRRYNLKLNEKTKLERFNDSKKIEEIKFYNSYGGINETSEEKVNKIHSQLPDIFKLVNEEKHLDKKENGSLRYYLKASTNFLYIENFIDLISQKSSLVYLICRYISIGLYL